jgi:hypothetical protein
VLTCSSTWRPSSSWIVAFGPRQNVLCTESITSVAGLLQVLKIVEWAADIKIFLEKCSPTKRNHNTDSTLVIPYHRPNPTPRPVRYRGSLLWPLFNPTIIESQALGIVRAGFIGARTRLGPSEHARLFVMAPNSTCLFIVDIDYCSLLESHDIQSQDRTHGYITDIQGFSTSSKMLVSLLESVAPLAACLCATLSDQFSVHILDTGWVLNHGYESS